MKYFALALMFCSSTVLAAGVPQGRNTRQNLGELIDDQGLDATRTFEINHDVEGEVWGVMVVYVQVTDADDSVDALTMSCSTSLDNNNTNYAIQSITASAGVGTSTDASWVKDASSIASPKRWAWRVDIEGMADVRCSFSQAAGAAADKLDVSVSLAVKG